MIKTSIEKMAKDIGFDIGMSDDVVQADLLNGLCEALSKLNERDLGMQLSYISHNLTPKSKEILIKLKGFLVDREY